MPIWKRRPALVAFLLFWAGILLYSRLEQLLWISLGAALIGLLGIRPALFLLFLPIGAFYLINVGLLESPKSVGRLSQGAFLIQGIAERHARVLAHWGQKGTVPLDGTARVTRLPELRPGELWWVWAKVLRKPRWKGPGEETVLFILSAYRLKTRSGLLGRIQDHLDRELRWLAGESSLREGLLRALFLGERGKLPEPLLEAFRRTGTIHLLAISGLHVGLIALLFAGGLGILRLSRKWILAGTALGLIGFAWLVSLRPSVLRAVILFLTYVLGELSGRRRDPLNLLGVAGLLSLALNPLWAFAPGFHLSYAATFGILYLLPSGRMSPWIRRLLLPFWISITAGIFTFPLLAYHFQRVPFLGIPASPFLVLLLFWGMAEGLIALLIHPIIPGIAELFALQTRIAMEGILRGVWFLHQLPHVELKEVSLSPPALLLWYGGFLTLRPLLYLLLPGIYRHLRVSVVRRTAERGT